MEKTLNVELPIAVDAPAVPGVDWDEIHEGYLAKLEQENPGLSKEDRFAAAIEEGLASIKAGRTVPLEEARAYMEQKFGLRR
jgi:hypothetical protein